MGVMAVPDSVRDDALSYVRIYFLSLPFVALYDNVASCLRGVGDSKTPLYAQIVGGVANVVLDAVALIVFGLGVDGVAWATFFLKEQHFCLPSFALGHCWGRMLRGLRSACLSRSRKTSSSLGSLSQSKPYASPFLTP